MSSLEKLARGAEVEIIEPGVKNSIEGSIDRTKVKLLEKLIEAFANQQTGLVNHLIKLKSIAKTTTPTEHLDALKQHINEGVIELLRVVNEFEKGDKEQMFKLRLAINALLNALEANDWTKVNESTKELNTIIDSMEAVLIIITGKSQASSE